MKRSTLHFAYLLLLCSLIGLAPPAGSAFAEANPPPDAPPATKPDPSEPAGKSDGLIDDLLDGIDSDVLGRVQKLMERSKDRLHSGDSGEDTQAVQERIVQALEDLLKKFENAPKSSCKSTSKAGEMGQPKPSAGNSSSKSAPVASRQPATNSNSAAGNPSPPTSQSSGESFVSAAEPLMKIAPRLRPAVIEGAGETVCEKYRGLVADYYKTLADRATRNAER